MKRFDITEGECFGEWHMVEDPAGFVVQFKDIYPLLRDLYAIVEGTHPHNDLGERDDQGPHAPELSGADAVEELAALDRRYRSVFDAAKLYAN